MKLLISLAKNVFVCTAMIAAVVAAFYLKGWFSPSKTYPDHFYAAAQVAAPGAGAQSVFAAGQAPTVFIQGPGFENKELRIIVSKIHFRVPPSLIDVMRSEPVMIGAGNHHAWKLEDLKPAAYEVTLLINGRRDRTIEIEVRK